MITGNMLVMFIIGFIIFTFYIVGLLYAIWWGHSSQREDMLNDPELRDYYNRYPSYSKEKKRKKGSQSRMKNYFWKKEEMD
jgi:type IV secretory pathway TrbD component